MRLRVTSNGDLPSDGKDKIGFYGLESNHNQPSPDPQGNSCNMINLNMMIVDSATPMFTSEFNFMTGGANLAVGGLESSAIGASSNTAFMHPALINEWNPAAPLMPSVS